MKLNLHHLFHFVDLGEICNMEAVAIGTVELWSNSKQKRRRELYYRFKLTLKLLKAFNQLITFLNN